MTLFFVVAGRQVTSGSGQVETWAALGRHRCSVSEWRAADCRSGARVVAIPDHSFEFDVGLRYARLRIDYRRFDQTVEWEGRGAPEATPILFPPPGSAGGGAIVGHDARVQARLFGTHLSRRGLTEAYLALAGWAIVWP